MPLESYYLPSTLPTTDKVMNSGKLRRLVINLGCVMQEINWHTEYWYENFGKNTKKYMDRF
jgi:hypothetical protein